MKKITLKSILFFVLTLCSSSITAQGVLPSSDTFRLRNVATGEFLTDAGASAQPVTMTNNLDEDDVSTHWTFVESGAFYNIDNKDDSAGILRAPGAGGPGGPYVVLSTFKAPPASDNDKTWTISHNSTNDTYRFESRTPGRFMYHEVDGTVTHALVADTDDRSNWELVPYVQTPVVVPDDEDTSADLTCPSSGEFQNDSTRNVDVPSPVNVGTADDRTCYSDYSQFDLYGKTWGVYNITDGSNHWDGATLQPRIERSLSRSGETGVGSYARFTGTFRILEVGDAGSFGQDGTYIAQAKGKHTGGGGSPDPAICLYRAHPVYGTGINADKQVAFDIYAERITERGGEGSSGREVVFLKQVDKDEEVSFELEVGFREDPSDPTKKIHYCDAVIGGDPFNFNIPDPERGLESGIRYGAYRVRGGRAQIRWAETTYDKMEVVDSGDAPEGIYRLKNVATDKYLMSSGTTIVASDSGEGSDKEWQFVAVPGTSYYNIDSQFGSKGVIRHNGAFELVSTNVSPPISDNDKMWDVIDNGDGSYSFEAVGKAGVPFLYHDVDNAMVISTNTDNRSKWILESTTLSSSDAEVKTASIKIYPNPANDRFTIALKNISNIEGVEIYSILGKRVYQNVSNGSDLVVDSANFKAGVYLVKAIVDGNKTYHTKLVIK
ncbi:T9SS type A sorting domain-containing protein [Hyunsoonleella rubra]|uniref:T9SS type A sorting domain-containing protein n=1 Tax=Hyunsoonleella rubra TaxID=1737062 RepID=A0ABW5TF03_9FLAO